MPAVVDADAEEAASTPSEMPSSDALDAPAVVPSDRPSADDTASPMDRRTMPRPSTMPAVGDEAAEEPSSIRVGRHLMIFLVNLLWFPVIRHQ